MSKEREDSFKLTEQNKKTLIKLGALLILGIILMAVSSYLTREPQQNQTGGAGINQPPTAAQPTSAGLTEEERLEQKLAKALGGIEGISRVTVSLTFAEGSRTEYATNESTSQRSVEEAGQDGSRSTSLEETASGELVLPPSAAQPVIVQQQMPVVQGVLVTALGVEDSNRVLMITRALQGLLDIPANKIVICPAKLNVQGEM